MKRTILSSLALSLLLTGGNANALDQAFCALRDPSNEIYALFPTGNSYKSIVRDLSEKEVRDKIADELGIPLHFSELGKHTLYVVYEDRNPIGLVHARPELGKWGIVEVAWAMDLDLNIIDFSFVRCRDKSKKVFQEDVKARAVFQGADIEKLRHYMTPGSYKFNKEIYHLEANFHQFADLLLINAVKTLIVTQIAWQEDLVKITSQ